MAYLQRRGALAQKPDGTYILINDAKKGYKAERALMVVWDMCDGTRTEHDIIRDLAQRMETSERKVSKTVPLIINKLKACGLVV